MKNRFRWKKPGKKTVISVAVLLLQVVVNFSIANRIMGGKAPTEVSYSEFLTQIEEKNINEVQVENDQIYFNVKEQIKQEEQSRGFLNFSREENANYYYTIRMEDEKLTERLEESGAEFSRVVESDHSLLSTILSFLFSFGLPLLIFYFMMKNMGKQTGNNFMSFGKSNAKIYVKPVDGISFSDVAGEDEAKESLMEIVNYLEQPEKYKKIGASMPKGALLVGPPGTGKTLLAKAVAGEANVPFFSISGSEFVEMFVGMGAAKVRDLFKQAAEKAPCIVFIDEIDTIGKKRDAHGMTGNDEREQTLNQLLTEMDGFDASKGVVILAACNRPDSLDPALLRPGRFDRRITVDLPDHIGREDILRVHAKKVRMGDNVDLHTIARMTSGASGADLANMINESALRAVREKREYVLQEDLEESVETVLAGYKKKNAIFSEKEKMIVSYHEIGHAMVAALQTNSAPVTKITIIPRTSGALGYTMQVDEEERHIMSKTELENKIATLAGGRAAEKVIFNETSSGASNDIEQATKLARTMISRYGMSEELGMAAFERVESVYLGGDASLQCSEAIAETIDRGVIALVKQQEDKAVQILRENIGKLHQLAQYLFENETISGEKFMELLEQN